jgi:hypothetical protein
MLGLESKQSADGRKEPLIDENKKVEADSTSPSIVLNLSGVTLEPETFSPPFVRRGQQPTTEPTLPQEVAAKPQGGSSTEALPTLPVHDKCRPQDEQSEPSRSANPETAVPPAPVQVFWDTLFGSPVAPASSHESGNKRSITGKDSSEASAYQPPTVVNRKMVSQLTPVEEGQPSTAIEDENSQGNQIRGGGDLLAPRALSRSALEGFQPDALSKTDGQIPSKVPSTEGWSGYFRRVQTFFVGPLLLVPIFLFIAAGMILGASKEFGYKLNISRFFEDIDWDEELNVAFIGNAYLFVNDVPRVVQALSDDLMYQDSVIHPGGSLGSLLRTGNGMYKAWRTEQADIGGKYYENYGGYKSMYDYGACTVRFGTFLVSLLAAFADFVVYAVVFVARLVVRRCC